MSPRTLNIDSLPDESGLGGGLARQLPASQTNEDEERARYKWLQSDLSRIRELAEDHRLTAAQIAAHFGMTRNQIITKCNRVGIQLANRQPYTGNLKGIPKTKVPKTRFDVPNDAPATATTENTTSPPSREVMPIEQKPTLAMRTSRPCQWPLAAVGRGTYAFCNEDCAPGKSYCTAHARIAYKAPADRRSTRSAVALITPAEVRPQQLALA